VTSLSSRALSAVRRAISGTLTRGQEDLRLRTKLLLSFVILTISLTTATLLAVHRNAEDRAQQEIEKEAATAMSTFQVMQRQQEITLNRRADLLASLAFMRNGDVTTIEDAGNDPWQSDDCNLFLLTDARTKIVAMHVSGTTFPEADAQAMLTGSLGRAETSGWWLGGGKLYQVVLQPFYEEPSGKRDLEGYVVIGRLMDERAARNLAKITTSEIVLRYGNEVTASTLQTVRDQDLTRQIRKFDEHAQVELGGQRYYASSIDLMPGVNSGANLVVLKSYNEVQAYLQRLDHLLLALGLATILAGSILIFIISATVTRPLASLVQGVKAVERGDFTYPLDLGGHDELSQLTRAFDGMRRTLKKDEDQREQLESQLRQAQKMEALGRLAGGVAHDFNNLLTVIAGHSDLLNDRLKDDALHSHCQQIRKTADRAAALTRQLLVFSRKQLLQTKVVDLNDLIVDTGKLVRRLVREDIELSLQLGDSLGRVKADASQMEQVLLNLIVNASDAMPLGGKLTIETKNAAVDKIYAATRTSLEPGDYVVLSVTDTGHGMDAATKARIFEPFFTTKEPGKGTGLGLATVYGVVKQSGGFIWVESELNRGTRFEIYLPKTNGIAEDPEVESQTKYAGSAVRPTTVLVVEDEREVRELACEFLKGAGYSVLTAADGQEALETAQRLGKSIQAVLTDLVMPGMRGTELGVRLKSLLPHLKLIYMTGYLEQQEGDVEFPLDAHFLQKPFSRESVVRQVAEALNSKAATGKTAVSKPRVVARDTIAV
jgi:signal transduction histidine kinase/FixJ family two-component response regulator